MCFVSTFPDPSRSILQLLRQRIGALGNRLRSTLSMAYCSFYWRCGVTNCTAVATGLSSLLLVVRSTSFLYTLAHFSGRPQRIGSIVMSIINCEAQAARSGAAPWNLERRCYFLHTCGWCMLQIGGSLSLRSFRAGQDSKRWIPEGWMNGPREGLGTGMGNGRIGISIIHGRSRRHQVE